MQSPSNVTLIARAIKQYGDPVPRFGPDRIPQIVYYQKGVGSSLDTLERLPVFSLFKPKGHDASPFDGAFGVGLEDNVRAGYGFLAHNFERDSDDEIYLFGWSRGAYTARSIAGLVSAFGLLDKSGMDRIGEVYQAYRKGWFSDKASEEDKKNGEELKLQCAPGTPRIRCIGVWDTVGSMGIPNLEVFGEHVPFLSDINKKYEFHDTNLHPNVDFGFHA